MDINIDPNEMTIGEIEEIEQLTEVSFGEIAEQLTSGKFQTKVLSAIIKVCVSRTDPGFTIEDARALKISELNIIANPTEAANEPQTGPASPAGSESDPTSTAA